VRFGVGRADCRQLPLEERSGGAGVALDGRLGDAEQLGDLRHLEAGEKPQLDDLGEAFVELGEARQRAVDVEELLGVRLDGDRPRRQGVDVGVLRSRPAAVGQPRPRVVDHHLPHRLGGGGEEVFAVFEAQRRAVEELEVGLVDEGAGVERLAAPVARELGTGDPLQVAVDARQQLVLPRGVARQAGERASQVLLFHRSSGADPSPRGWSQARRQAA
jgi:hypothetical protein